MIFFKKSILKISGEKKVGKKEFHSQSGLQPQLSQGFSQGVKGGQRPQARL